MTTAPPYGLNGNGILRKSLSAETFVNLAGQPGNRETSRARANEMATGSAVWRPNR
jgi:hypothetical protein